MCAYVGLNSVQNFLQDSSVDILVNSILTANHTYIVSNTMIDRLSPKWPFHCTPRVCFYTILPTESIPMLKDIW